MSRKQAEYDVVQLTKSLPSPTFITLPHAEGICRARALPDSVGGGKNLVLVCEYRSRSCWKSSSDAKGSQWMVRVIRLDPW